MSATPEIKKPNSTFILFSTKNKLSLRDLKSTFAVTHGRLFNINRNTRWFSNVFDKFFGIKNSDPENGIYIKLIKSQAITHLFITKPNSVTKDFGIMKYGSELLGGFDVSTDTFDELSDLVDTYVTIANFCGYEMDVLRDICNESKDVCVFDPVTPVDLINHLMHAMNSCEEFGLPKLNFARSKIDAWEQAHTWTDIYNATAAQNNDLNLIAA